MSTTVTPKPKLLAMVITAKITREYPGGTSLSEVNAEAEKMKTALRTIGGTIEGHVAIGRQKFAL